MEKENTLKSMESINCLVSKISTFVVSRRKNNLRVKYFFSHNYPFKVLSHQGW